MIMIFSQQDGWTEDGWIEGPPTYFWMNSATACWLSLDALAPIPSPSLCSYM